LWSRTLLSQKWLIALDPIMRFPLESTAPQRVVVFQQAPIIAVLTLAFVNFPAAASPVAVGFGRKDRPSRASRTGSLISLIILMMIMSLFSTTAFKEHLPIPLGATFITGLRSQLDLVHQGPIRFSPTLSSLNLLFLRPRSMRLPQVL
jgi:hypothetical protein